MDQPASPPARPRRGRRRLRALALVFAGLAGLLAVALVAGWQTLRTDAGTAWLLSKMPGLQARGVRGSLQGGPFSAARVEYGRESDRVHVVIDGLVWRDLRWRWRPVPGLWAGLQIDGLQAARVTVHTRPGAPASAAPGTLPRLRLPLELALPDVQVQALYVNALPPVSGLQAGLHLGAEGGSQHRLDHLAFDWDRLHLQAQGRLQADAPMAVSARAELRSQASGTGPLGTPWRAELHAGGTLPRLALDGHLRAEPGPRQPAATLDLHGVVVPFEAWPLAALQADMQGLDLAALASAAPETRIDGHAIVQSTGLDRPAQVDLQLRNALPGRWDETRLPLQQLTLRLQGRPDQPRHLALQAFDAVLGSAQEAAGRLTGSGHWQGNVLALEMQAHDVQPAQLDHRLAAMRVGGPLKLNLRGLAGDASGWQVDLDTQLDGRLQAAPGTPPVRLRAQAEAGSSAEGLRIQLRELQATAGSARANAKASATRDAEGHWQVSSQGELSDFDPLPWWPGPEGSAWRQGGHRLNGRWNLSLALPASPASTPSMRWAGLRGQADLQLTDSRLAGVPLQAKAALHADGSTPLARLTAEVQAAGNRLALQGQFGLAGDGRADRWQLDTQADALAALAPVMRLLPSLAAWAPTSGRLALKAEAQGRWPQLASSGDAQLDGLKAGPLAAGTAHAQWRFGGGPDAPLTLQLRADRLARGAQRIDHLRADLSGTLRHHQLQAQAGAAARPPAWTDALLGAGAGKGTTLRLAGDGRWEPAASGGRWTGQLQQLQAGPDGLPDAAWLRADGLQLELGFNAGGALEAAAARAGQLQLLGATLRWSRLQWQAGADGVPRIDVQARLDPLPVAPLLARLQPDFGWGGDLRVSGEVNVQSAAAFNAEVVVERAGGDLKVTDEGGTQALGLTDLRLGMSAHNGVWHFTQAAAGSTVGVVAGAQSFRLPPRAVWPGPDTPMEGVLELRVDNLGVWGPWTPAGWRLVGKLHTSATIGGRFGAPEYTGLLEAEGLGARNLLQGINFTDGQVRIALKGPVAQIERFTVKGGDGSLKLEGGATFGDTPHAQLKLDASRFQLLGRVDRRLVASGRGELALDEEAIRFDGRFAVDEGLIDFSRGDAPTLDDDVSVVRRNGSERTSGAGAAAEAPAAGPSKPPRAVQANVAVDLGEHLRLRGRGLDTFLRGELRTTTPGGRLAVNGTVRAEDGTYQAYGQKLEIERGLVTFTGPVENPRLDILALRPNLDVRVGVLVGGTALSPRVRLYSEPEMADADKLSWLVLGRAPEGLGRADTALLQHAAMALLSGEGESAPDKVLHSLGLDDISVRQEGEGELRSTVVSLGKQLSRRWYVGYERGVNSTAGSWQLIYRIAQRFTLRAQSGEDNALDLIWTWRWN